MHVFPKLLISTLALIVFTPQLGVAHNGADHGSDPAMEIKPEFSIKDRISECGGFARRDIYALCDEENGTNQLTIYEDGVRLAKQTQRLVILEYGANWCGTCKQVHRMWEAQDEATKMVRAELDQKFVFIPINADGPESFGLVEAKVGAGIATGYPTTYVIDPQSNTIKARVALYEAQSISQMKTILLQAADASSSDGVSRASEINYMGAASVGLLNKDIDISSIDVGPAYLIKDATSDVDRLINAGTAFMNVFDWASAYRAYNKAVSIDGKNIYAHVGRIISAYELDSGQASEFVKDSYQFLSAEINKQENSQHQRLWAKYGVAVYHSKSGNFVPTAGETLLNVRSVYQEMVRAFPEDIEVLTLANWNSGSYDMGHFEKAFQMDPRHPGVNHYIGHMQEMMQNHDQAFGYLKTLAEVAPDGAHAQHMYGHVLPLMGEWENADVQFAKSHQIHLDWAERNGVAPSEDWHYPHNLHLWGVVKLALGKADEAVDLMAEGCTTDFRACMTWFELNIILGNFDDVGQKISQFIGYSESYRPYLMIYVLETVFHMGQEKNVRNFQTYQPKNSFETLLVQMMKSRDTGLSEETKNQLRKEFREKLDGAGFDAWTSGLLQLTRYLKVVESLGDNEFANELKTLLRNLAPQIYTDIDG